MDEQQIKLSAWCDGELDGAERAEIERLLAAQPDCAAMLAQYRRLDAAAAALPVPEAQGALYSPVDIQEMLGQPLPANIQNEVETAPEIAPERFAKVWSAIAAQTSAPGLAVPAVNAQQWDRVWTAIRGEVAALKSEQPLRTTSSLVANLPQGKSDDAAPRAGNIVRATRWRWLGAAAIAAMVTAAVLVGLQYKSPPPDNGVALELPGGSERYEVSIEYAHGDPIVCYWLKPDAHGNDTDHDWRWLPD